MRKYIFIISLLFLCSCSGTGLDLDLDLDQLVYDRPQNISQKNALKRARQISQIEWTPLNDLPSNSGFYSAGEIFQGMPYSSVKELDKFVGLEVSFETFMTAIHNPRSVLYTENVRKAPYNGVNCASFYGVVCSSVVNYSLGLKVNYVTNCLDTLSLFTRITQQVPESIQLCDVLWSRGHEVMVYDIARNPSDSTIEYVSILEAGGTKTRIHGYSFKDFKRRWEDVKWVIYRYNGFDKEIHYDPSPFVLLDGEITPPYKYNDVICPSRGNGAVYREGENVVINVLHSSFTNLLLFRDGQLLEERKSIETNEEYKGLQYGRYTAVAKDSYGNQSDAISFDVVDAMVNAQNKGGIVEIDFRSKYGEPEYVKFCKITGEVLLIRDIQDKEKSLGHVEVNWPGQYTELYCKVMFSTPNGMVTNLPILIKKQ